MRLAAQEKGIRWREYLVDIHGALTQLEPWYMKLNPKAYVPTMLLGRGEEMKAVCESKDIIQEIDSHFENDTQLIPRDDSTEAK